MRTLHLTLIALTLVACGGGSDNDAGSAGMDGGGAGSDAGGGGADGGGGGGDGGGGTDAGETIDAGPFDAGGGTDGGSTDAGPFDAGAIDAGDPACAAMDAREGRACGPTERPFPRYVWNGIGCDFAAWCDCLGADCGERYDTEDACLAAYRACLTPCTTDAECPSATAWCEGGVCVPCDNSGLLCDIACSTPGWMTYERNGCFPCECGPPNECVADTECGRGEVCYAGAFCWCSDGGRRPDCCIGNVCEASGCTTPPPTGCTVTGCARGQTCVVDAALGCASASCNCPPTGSWSCNRDCAGGVCITP